MCLTRKANYRPNARMESIKLENVVDGYMLSIGNGKATPKKEPSINVAPFPNINYLLTKKTENEGNSLLRITLI